MADTEVVRKALEALAEVGCLQPRSLPAMRVVATRETDAYWQAAQEALRQIAGQHFLPGAIRWLAKHQPERYAELTEQLPAEIDRLWDECVPLGTFQAVLSRWVEAHRQALALYPVRRGLCPRTAGGKAVSDLTARPGNGHLSGRGAGKQTSVLPSAQ